MKKSHKDRLANEAADELVARASDIDERLADEIEVDLADRDRVRRCLEREERGDLESCIESAQALIDRLDLDRYDGGVTWELEQRVHHARAVLANAFFALYGGFGERPAVEA